MTEKQKKFCEEYLVDLNATQSAIRAGYSKKSAYSVGQRMLKYAEVKNWIDEQLTAMSRNKIADAQEVMEYLTSVLRGEVVEGKPLSTKDRLKAAELLAKRYGLLTEKLSIESSVVVIDETGMRE